MWTTDLVEMLRVLIGDTDSTAYVYSDARLQRVIVIAAVQTLQEIDFVNIYVVNIDAGTIVPDPIVLLDTAFTNLVCLKAACVLLDGESRAYAIGSLIMQDGPSKIDLTSRYSFVKAAAQVMKEQYALAKILYQSGQGQAILTPTTNPAVYPGANNDIYGNFGFNGYNDGRFPY